MVGNMKNFLCAIILATLAACGGGSPTPTPTPIPIPVTIPYPGTLAGSMAFALPMGIALKCTGDATTPFTCTLPAGASLGVLPGPGNGGIGCVDPEPNVCFNPHDGQLDWNACSPITNVGCDATGSGGGMALVSASTMPANGTMSVDAKVYTMLECPTPVSYVGPVLYDGATSDGTDGGNYRSLYISCLAAGGATNIQVWVYGPTDANPIATTVYPNGSTIDLRIDYVPGQSFTYIVNGSIVCTETAGHPCTIINAGNSQDPLIFTHPPHPAMWFGNAAGTVYSFAWYTGP